MEKLKEKINYGFMDLLSLSKMREQKEMRDRQEYIKRVEKFAEELITIIKEKNLIYSEVIDTCMILAKKIEQLGSKHVNKQNFTDILDNSAKTT